MRLSGFAVSLITCLLIGQSLLISSYAQPASTGNPPKVAPSKQALFTPEEEKTLHKIVRDEINYRDTGAVVTILITLLGVGVTIYIAGIRKAIAPFAEKAEKEAQKIVAEIETIRNNAKTQAEEVEKILEQIQTIRNNAEVQAAQCFEEIRTRGEEILADFGRTSANRPRYVLVQGGSIEKPHLEFEVLLLVATTQVKTVVNTIDLKLAGFLRLVGGTAYETFIKKDKNAREWHECFVTFNPKDSAITVERYLIGDAAGQVQHFHSKPPPSVKPIQTNKTAKIWEGLWSGKGATTNSGEKTFGAFIIYLD